MDEVRRALEAKAAREKAADEAIAEARSLIEAEIIAADHGQRIIRRRRLARVGIGPPNNTGWMGS
jgi:hypothetical protein